MMKVMHPLLYKFQMHPKMEEKRNLMGIVKVLSQQQSRTNPETSNYPSWALKEDHRQIDLGFIEPQTLDITRLFRLLVKKGKRPDGTRTLRASTTSAGRA
jgi:hypothetical protein